MPVKVFLTVDVEIWCDGWRDIDAKFPRAFEQYVYGATRDGRFGLPFILNTLAENGLVILQELLAVSARLVVNRAAYRLKIEELLPLLEKLGGAA